MNKTVKTRIAAPPRMDAAGAELLAVHLDEAIRAGAYEIGLDMSGTGFLSSAGVRVLLTYYQKLKKLGGRLAIEAMSESARGVIELSGLLIMAEPGPAPASVAGGDAGGGTTAIEHGSVEVAIETLNEKALVPCRYVGEPCLPGSTGFGAAPLVELPIGPGLCGVGLGAFGEKTDGISSRVGEWMSVCGMSVGLPPDSGVPDYMTASGALRPKAQVLYAACFESGFAHAGRFSPAAGAGDALLGDLLAAAFEWSGAQLIGVALAGEASGLIGVCMTKSPLAPAAAGDYFAHPAVRGNLALTPEPEHSGEMALVVGMAVRGDPGGRGRRFMRLADSGAGVWAHLHAAVFPFRALPSGRLAPAAVARDLVESERPRAVLHLLNDERPVTGLGQSAFRNGVIWTAPLREDESGAA